MRPKLQIKEPPGDSILLIAQNDVHKSVEKTCFFYRLAKTSQSCTRLHKLVQACTSLYKVVQLARSGRLGPTWESCTRLYKVVQGCTRLYKVAQGCTRLYKVVQGCTRLYKVVQGCTIGQAEPGWAPTWESCSRLYKVVQVCTRLYKFVQSCASSSWVVILRLPSGVVVSGHHRPSQWSGDEWPSPPSPV